MLTKNFMIEDKKKELRRMSQKDLIDRVCNYPNQDALNFTAAGESRNFQAGILASEVRSRGYNGLTDSDRYKLIETFANMTIASAQVVNIFSEKDTIELPNGFDGYSQWDFVSGDADDLHINFFLTEEKNGRVSVGVPINDFSVTKIGYLEDDFVKDYPVHGNRIMPGSYKYGHVEIPFDMEKLYDESMREPKLTEEGYHIYEKRFELCNVPKDKHTLFEETMNAFPVKEMAGDVLRKTSTENPIVNISHHVGIDAWPLDASNRVCAVRIETSEPLDGCQMGSLNQFFNYLQETAGEDDNLFNGQFSEYMKHDFDFITTVGEIYVEHNINKRQFDPFMNVSNYILSEVKAEQSLSLTADDFKDLENTDGVNL